MRRHEYALKLAEIDYDLTATPDVDFQAWHFEDEELGASRLLDREDARHDHGFKSQARRVVCGGRSEGHPQCQFLELIRHLS